MTDPKHARGWQGAVLKLLRAGDYRLTVTGRSEISAHYLRLSFDADGMLAGCEVHPTMWIRMWFADGHQRAYTLVDPDSVADTFDLEFALHDGAKAEASRWALAARPGDTIEATVLGSKFAIPQPSPAGYVIVGDASSLPAVNSLLAAIGDAPVRVFLEAGHHDDKELPVSRGTDVIWVDRENNGEALVQAVSSAAFDADGHFGWVACDTRTTRAISRVLREDYGIPRKSIKAQAYWVA